MPALVTKLQASQMIEKNREEITKRSKKINKKIQKILTNPAQNDPVFKAL
jgi:hypothetical protein